MSDAIRRALAGKDEQAIMARLLATGLVPPGSAWVTAGSEIERRKRLKGRRKKGTR